MPHLCFCLLSVIAGAPEEPQEAIAETLPELSGNAISFISVTASFQFLSVFLFDYATPVGSFRAWSKCYHQFPMIFCLQGRTYCDVFHARQNLTLVVIFRTVNSVSTRLFGRQKANGFGMPLIF